MDADSLRIWDNRTFFSRQLGEARAFLSRSYPNFSHRLTAAVRKTSTSHDAFTLADLQDFLTDVLSDDERSECTFTFLSAVEMLRQALTVKEQAWLAEDIFYENQTCGTHCRDLFSVVTFS